LCLARGPGGEGEKRKKGKMKNEPKTDKRKNETKRNEPVLGKGGKVKEEDDDEDDKKKNVEEGEDKRGGQGQCPGQRT
jgi:hypothetical protein